LSTTNRPDIVLEGNWEFLRYIGNRDSFETYLNALEGKLEPIRLTVINRNKIDAYRHENKPKEISESQIDAHRQRDEEEYTPFLDTLPSPEIEPEEPIDLKNLCLNFDKLAPRELSIVEDVLRGYDEGYDFASKQGLSFKQRWGKDYERNIKAFKRAKDKLKLT